MPITLILYVFQVTVLFLCQESWFCFAIWMGLFLSFYTVLVTQCLHTCVDFSFLWVFFSFCFWRTETSGNKFLIVNPVLTENYVMVLLGCQRIIPWGYMLVDAYRKGISCRMTLTKARLIGVPQSNLLLLNMVGIIDQFFRRNGLQCKTWAWGREVSRIPKAQRGLTFVGYTYIWNHEKSVRWPGSCFPDLFWCWVWESARAGSVHLILSMRIVLLCYSVPGTVCEIWKSFREDFKKRTWETKGDKPVQEEMEGENGWVPLTEFNCWEVGWRWYEWRLEII